MILCPLLQMVDENGEPYAFALAYFYATGTTTPIEIYASADDVDDTLTNPVVADEKGLWPPIFIDSNTPARMVLVAAGGDLEDPLIDVDPVNTVISVGAANLEDGAIEGKLGYTPVNPANAIFTAQARMTIEDPLEVLHEDDMGFRCYPRIVKNVNYTLTLDDAGKLLQKDDTSTPTWTIPPQSDVEFPNGSWIELLNVNTGAVSIARGAGVELRIAGSSTNANVSLAAWGNARLLRYDTDKWLIQGTGVS